MSAAVENEPNPCPNSDALDFEDSEVECLNDSDEGQDELNSDSSENEQSEGSSRLKRKIRLNPYLVRFRKNLKKLCGDDNLWHYKYYGGRDNNDCGKQHLTYWEQCHLPNEVFPPIENECLCEHWINENCFIKYIGANPEGLNKILVIGNCCIKKYLPKELQGKTCNRCGLPHRNRKDNFCKECRKKRVEEAEQEKVELERVRLAQLRIERDNEDRLSRERERMEAARFKADMMFQYGKYANRKWSWVFENDPAYLVHCQFVLKWEDPVEYAFKRDPNWINNVVLDFGKYKGSRTIGWVRKNDPSYVSWCLKSIKDVPKREMCSTPMGQFLKLLQLSKLAQSSATG